MILPVWSTATPARSGSATAVETHPAGNVHHHICLLFAGVCTWLKKIHITVIQVRKHSTLSSALVTVNNKRLLRYHCIKGTVLIFFFYFFFNFFFNLSSSLILEKFQQKNSLNNLVNELNQTILLVLAMCVCVF